MFFTPLAKNKQQNGQITNREDTNTNSYSKPIIIYNSTNLCTAPRIIKFQTDAQRLLAKSRGWKTNF
jgi:hypothetical protein